MRDNMVEPDDSPYAGTTENCSKCNKHIHFQDEPHWSAGECSDCWTPDMCEWCDSAVGEYRNSDPFLICEQCRQDAICEGDLDQ